MLKTDKVIVVEGKYDKIKLSSLIDAVIIQTDGFSIFKDKDKQKLLRRIAEDKGIVILTDSDSAGFKIRNFIGGFIPKEYIVNAYIPDIPGKEKRKDSYSKEGKLGVEGVSAEIIRSSLEKAGVVCTDNGTPDRRQITKNDFYFDGLTGSGNSKKRRSELLEYLGLPQRMTTNAMIDIMNRFMTYDEYKEALKLSEKR